ncbi:hypothetical protein E4U35_002579 [Claviceps purpurea]|nr:hypothetical protein E4U36_004074 [Claviceps purpurea]KAG6198044.1 hypothetical protein E4U50_007663 [Claviceps purpurea]KAG6205481.1 hypothetical protein E4U35_002579 [Claviceps purpurea]KAG6242297.1 hypothetical protein E4U23_006942 [Claviceps purpurea]KAG6278010.1 hypothetical protein E4U47_006316 [Claviceps purpurea]
MKHNTLSLAIAAAGAQQAAATFGLLNGLLGGNLGAGLHAGANVDAHAGGSLGGGLGGGLGVHGDASFDFGSGFTHAPSFNTPHNVDNQCTPEQEKGWDFKDLPTGSFDKYLGFQFGGGWNCEASTRGMLQGRTFGNIAKIISGLCPLNGGLDIGLGAHAGVDAFSIGSIDLSTEFDVRLEFHYDMQDGSVCKHSADCKKGGSTIVNNQCGGAKKVKIVYPPQPSTSKKTCKISCHKISWHCGNGGSPPPSGQVSIPGTLTASGFSSTGSIPGVTTTPTTPDMETTPGVTTSATSATTSPGQDTTPSYPGATSSAATSGTSSMPGASTDTTPGASTNTQSGTTDVQSTQSTSGPATFVTSISSAECHACSSTETSYLTVPGAVTTVQTGDKPQPTTPGGKPSPPCPQVVPRCLNTFLELKSKCKDNKDAACYCPNKDFVNVVFNCIYAHGENDNVISEAISFFQGMCGQYIPQNPAIATGCKPIIEIITVTGTPRITNVPYTTVAYSGPNAGPPAVVTVPVIAMPTGPAAGAPPQPTAPVVAQPTAPGAQPTAPAAGQPSVPAAAQPSMPAATPTGYTDAPGGSSPGASAPGGSSPGASTPGGSSPGGNAPGYEPVTVPAASGTGAYTPGANPTGGVPVTAGAGRVGAGMMIAAVAFIAAL